MTDPGRSFEERLREWLAESCGITDFRRIAWRDRDKVMLSKFEEGFARRLHDALDQVPELLDATAVDERYRRMSREQPGLSRVATWRAATDALVSELGESRALGRMDRAAIRGGLDSVAALLDSVLWSQPLSTDGWEPGTGERDAYRDVLAKMDADESLFTRVYGVFDGARVAGYCPGSRAGRALLEQAWTICTGAGRTEG